MLLATCLALATGKDGKSYKARILLDPCAEISFITKKLTRSLKLEKQNEILYLSSIGETPSGPTLGITSVNLHSLTEKFSINIEAYVMPSLTSTLPSFNSEEMSWSHLQGLQLADPAYLVPAPIDIIIGADYYNEIIDGRVIKGHAREPMAQATKFGWVITGPADKPEQSEAKTFHVQQEVARGERFSAKSRKRGKNSPPRTNKSLSNNERPQSGSKDHKC